MKYLKILGLAAVAALALMALASTASATTVEIKGVKQTGATTVNATLESGTSAILKDEAGTTTDTCTGSTVHGTTSVFTGATVSGPVSTLDFTGCSHTTDVLANGSISVAWIKGTTNGTVTSSGAEVQVRSTFFGANATCKTGGGTDIGTITGKSSGFATMDVNGIINCGILGNSTWTGSYWVTTDGFGITE